MIAIANHSFDESIMPEAPVVIDAGCRGFDFTQVFNSEGFRECRTCRYARNNAARKRRCARREQS